MIRFLLRTVLALLGNALGLDQRALDGGPRLGQVDHPLRLVLGKGGGHAVAVLDTQAQVSEAVIRPGTVEAFLLEADIVVGVEAVDANDLIATLQQPQ